MPSAVKAPPGLRTAGRRFYRAVISEFELDDHELLILAQAAQTVDLIADCQAEIAETGLILDSHGGRINPAVVEARQQRLVLLKAVGSLRLPADVLHDERPGSRQRRESAAPT